jgi:hypothetical protein
MPQGRLNVVQQLAADRKGRNIGAIINIPRGSVGTVMELEYAWPSPGLTVITRATVSQVSIGVTLDSIIALFVTRLLARAIIAEIRQPARVDEDAALTVFRPQLGH